MVLETTFLPEPAVGDYPVEDGVQRGHKWLEVNLQDFAAEGNMSDRWLPAPGHATGSPTQSGAVFDPAEESTTLNPQTREHTAAGFQHADEGNELPLRIFRYDCRNFLFTVYNDSGEPVGALCAIADAACQDPVIKLDKAEELGYTIHKSDESPVALADGSEIPIIGRIELDIEETVTRTRTKHSVAVAPSNSLKPDLVLSRDFLKNTRLIFSLLEIVKKSVSWQNNLPRQYLT